MRTTFATLMTLLSFALFFSASLGQDKPSANPAKGSHDFGKVPSGLTYHVFDEGGRKVASYKSGEKTPMTLDCVQIEWPSTFKDAVCWKCHERAIKRGR